MRRNIVCCAVIATIGSTMAAAAAWCPEKHAENNAALSASADTRAAGCIGQCIHPCEPASCDHRCTPRGGGEIRAITVADRTHSGCGKAQGHKKSGKSGCDKPCHAKGATTVADKDKTEGKAGGHKPCHAKGATAVADKAKTDGKADGHKPCHAKGATAVADKAKTDGKADGHKPCHAKGATAVADKAKTDGKADGHKPCHAKGATAVADKAKTDGKADGHKPCHAKGAAAVADKAKTDGKAGCNKPCGSKGAIAVADKDKGGAVRICPLTGEPLAPGADCPVDLLLASMPTMRYRVGEEETCCGRSAEHMAKKAGTSIAYLVGDKVFAEKRVATLELTKVLEAEVQKLQAMQFVADGQSHFCPMDAKKIAKKAKTKVTYRAGGFDFAEKAQAAKAIKLVADAVGKVHMAYRVDGIDYHCDKTAKSKANGNGKKLTYVVGQDETGCEVSAGLLVVQAKIRAIVEAAATATS